MTEKAGGFSKFRKHTTRAKEKMMQTLGKADKTTDEYFDDVCTKFYDQQTSAEKLQKEIKQYVSCVGALSNASKSFYETVRTVYEPDWPGIEHVKAMTQSVELLHQEYFDKLSEIVHCVNEYAGDFPDNKLKIAKRGRKLVDYDSARHNVESLQKGKKDDGKVAKAEEDLKEAKRNYEHINTELLDTLPALYDSRISFLAGTFQGFFSAEKTFHGETGRLCQDLSKSMDELSTESHRLRTASLASSMHRASISSEEKSVTPTKMATPPPTMLSSASPTAPPKKTPPSSIIQSSPAKPASIPEEKHNGDSTSLNPFDDEDDVESPTSDSAKSGPTANGVATVDGRPRQGSMPTPFDEPTPTESGDDKPPPGVEMHNERPVDVPGAPVPSKIYPEVVPVETKLEAEVKPVPPPEAAKRTQQHSPGAAAVEPSDVSKDSIVPADPNDRKVLYKVRATHQYNREDQDELSFEPGEIISVTPYDNPDDQDEGWSMGFKENGECGVFPDNFTQRIELVS